MHVIRKQKSEARKPRGADIMSDLENLNVMISGSHFERQDFDDLAGSPDSQSCANSAERNSYSNSNSRENEFFRKCTFN